MKFLINLLSLCAVLSFSYHSKAAGGPMALKDVLAEAQHILPSRGEVVWAFSAPYPCKFQPAMTCVNAPLYYKAQVLAHPNNGAITTWVTMVNEKGQANKFFSFPNQTNLLVVQKGCARYLYCVGKEVITNMDTKTKIVGIYNQDIVLTQDSTGLVSFFRTHDLTIE